MPGDVKQGLESAAGALKNATNGWESAVSLTERWLARAERVDLLLDSLGSAVTGRERARAQNLFFGVVRWSARLEAALAGLMAHPPRTKVRAVLLVAGYEMLERAQPAGAPEAGGVAKIIHHAVEKAKTVASEKEARLVNAVARKMADRLREPPADLATAFSHPAWLVDRWTRQFGADTTRKLLEWNQQPAPVFVRWRAGSPPPAFLGSTAWPGFFSVAAGHWDDVRRLAGEGALYVQDPSTRLCIELLAPKSGETILDACAAPGGKSLFIADRMQTGRVVAVDEPAPPGKTDLRLVRLRENLSRAPAGVDVALAEVDLTKVNTQFYRNLNLPESYDAVLLDAPCSNTGVMRHRVDVKWRLQDGDFARHSEQQLALLHAAAHLVKPGGRLVYSTCSVDPEENEQVVRRFFDSRAGSPFRQTRSTQAFPWTESHDGAAAFLLQRKE